MRLYSFLFFLLISFSYGIESNDTPPVVYELTKFFEIIKKTEISAEDSKNLIDKLVQILER